MKGFYTKRQDDFLRKKYSSLKHSVIARTLGRSIISIRKRGAKLGLNKHLKRWTLQEDLLLKRFFLRIPLKDFAKKLNRSSVEVSTRRKQLGLGSWKKPRKGTHSGRPILGFSKGQPIYTHRFVLERHLKRKLKSSEIVHHINFDKGDNTLLNLIVLSRSQHRKTHMSFEHLVPILVKKNIIGFDKQNLFYFLK